MSLNTRGCKEQKLVCGIVAKSRAAIQFALFFLLFALFFTIKSFCRSKFSGFKLCLQFSYFAYLGFCHVILKCPTYTFQLTQTVRYYFFFKNLVFLKQAKPKFVINKFFYLTSLNKS